MESKEYFEKIMQDYNQNGKGRSLRKYNSENMAKKANIQDPFEIIKKKIDTTGKEMLFTVMEFMNQKIDRTDFLAKMGSLSEKVDGIRAEEKELRTTFDRIIAQIEKLLQ